MRYIDKSNRCLQFDEYIQQYPPSSWEEFDGDIKLTLHQHLWCEQGELCIYCQQRLPPKEGKQASAEIRSHIEHIRPQKMFPLLIFVYENLSVSCEGFINNYRYHSKKEFCEHCKGDKYDETTFLNPVELQDIESYFEYNAEGYVCPSSKDKVRAEYMIKILCLNHEWLIEERKLVLDAVAHNQLEINSGLPPFYSMLKQFSLID